MPEKTYRVSVPVTVTITVTDEPVGDEDEPMHPLDPRRMEGIYDLSDPAEMLSHLAYNAVMNGLVCASVLDGWGDIKVLPEEADEWPQWQRINYVHDNHPVRMRITDVDTYDVDFIDDPPKTEDVQREQEQARGAATTAARTG